MYGRLLHIFRNTPFGRETLLQSVYFCKKSGLSLSIYIPKSTKFLMYFENDIVQVDLDDSYLKFSDIAVKHAAEIAESGGLTPEFLEPKNFTSPYLVDIPTTFDFMSCPRSITDKSSRIGLGHIGPRVRHIVKSAHFPVLIPSQVYKEWHSIAVFFGGSANAVNALKLGFSLSKASEMPLDVFTQVEKGRQKHYEEVIKDEKLEKEMNRYVRTWHKFEKGKFEQNFYIVPHDAMVILGAYGHGIIREIAFGSKMEKVHATLPNSLLIVGPRYAEIDWNEIH